MKRGFVCFIFTIVTTIMLLGNSIISKASDDNSVPCGYTEGDSEGYHKGYNEDRDYYFHDDDEYFQEDECSLASLSIDSTSVNLYILDDCYTDYISIPSNLRKTFQIEPAGMVGNVTYSVISGDSATVSSKGLVKPKIEVWYWLNGFGSSYPMEGATKTYEYTTGKTIIKVSDGKTSVKLTINVIDYAQYYTKLVKNKFISQNITSTMSDYEKIRAITSYVAQTYDYSADYSSATGMIISGGGDCWASSNLISDLCDLAGIKNHIRNANRDIGAGSGHLNVVALCDQKLYIADAGFTGTAPRNYSLYETDGFSSSDGTLYQYDGFDTNITIPSYITAIGNSGENVFYSSYDYENIKSISIPSSVTYISNVAFAGLSSLESLDIDPENETYKSINGSIYSKDGKTLYTVPNGKKSFTISNGTTTIGDYAFYYNSNISSVNIPSSVTYIGEGAFGDCSALYSVIVPSSVTTICDYAFYLGVTELAIISPKAELGQNILQSYFGNGNIIIGYVGSTAQTYAKSNSATFRAIDSNDIFIGTKDGKICLLSTSDAVVKLTCLRKKDGVLTYFKNGIKCNDKTLVKYNGKYYCVKNGLICQETTLVKYNNKYYYVKNGTICRTRTLMKYNGKYYYVKNGTICRTTGITNLNKKYYFIKNGVWSNKISIIKKCGKKTYYIKNGIVNTKYTGYKSYKGHVYYIKKGIATKRIK